MPELPEVQTVVDTLRPRVVGRSILRVTHVRDDMISPPEFNLRAALKSRTITDVSRRAKRIIFSLDDGNCFYIHLGMSGRLNVEPADAPTSPHTHLILDLSDASKGLREQIRFRDPRRFGGIFWLGREASDDPTLGPEPLKIRAKILHEKLMRTRRAIKTALLDQRLIAGLGNIYVDESLFAAGIDPLTPGDELSATQIARLTTSIKQTLRRAIRYRGSTLKDFVDADGTIGAYQKKHRVYGKEDEPCRNCKTKIKRIILGGRSTHFCPSCQKR